jgi:hypothetical protein
MRADVSHDFDWQNKFINVIKRILANYLITEAPLEEDAQHNTDLLVLKAETVRIACRIRRNSYVGYADEFTIRSDRPNGARTELAKLLSGWGDFIFYGIASPDESGLCAWVFGDLKEFRLWHHGYLARNKGKWPGTKHDNHDGSSSFYAYKIDDLPSAFIVARKRYEREAA